MTRLFKHKLALIALALPVAALASDQTQLGATVHTMRFTANLPSGNLGLKNASPSKLAAQRQLVVTGNAPQFLVKGQVLCKPGARLTAVQAIIGKAIVNQTELIAMADWGHSPKLTHVAGEPGAFVEIPVTLSVSRKVSGAAVDLTFNPALAYEKQLKTYVAKGNTAAEYLRETQAFDMEVSVNLVAWCKMDGGQGVLSGKTYPGVVTRKVPITILYNGDPAMIDNPPPRVKPAIPRAPTTIQRQRQPVAVSRPAPQTRMPAQRVPTTSPRQPR